MTKKSDERYEERRKLVGKFGVGEACKRLGISRRALIRYCTRHDIYAYDGRFKSSKKKDFEIRKNLYLKYGSKSADMLGLKRKSIVQWASLHGIRRNSKVKSEEIVKLAKMGYNYAYISQKLNLTRRQVCDFLSKNGLSESFLLHGVHPALSKMLVETGWMERNFLNVDPRPLREKLTKEVFKKYIKDGFKIKELAEKYNVSSDRINQLRKIYRLRRVDNNKIDIDRQLKEVQKVCII
jgi:hypothetical protein